jgi:hypothetical protein
VESFADERERGREIVSSKGGGWLCLWIDKINKIKHASIDSYQKKKAGKNCSRVYTSSVLFFMVAWALVD